MRFGPCGKIVDFGRRAYKTKCRFWRDSEETSEIEWVEVPETNPVQEGWSPFSMSEYQRGYAFTNGVGEVYGAPKPFTGRKAPADLKGTQQCGTAQDFAEGGLYQPDLPPAQYDAQGYLACCRVVPPPPPPPPPPPTPWAPTCQLAEFLAINTEYHATTLTTGGEQWWRWFPGISGTRFFQVAMDDGSAVDVVYWNNTGGCNDKGVPHNRTTPVNDVVTPPTGDVLLLVQLPVGTPAKGYTVKLSVF